MSKEVNQKPLENTKKQKAKSLIKSNGIDWGEHNSWKWQDLICHWRVLGPNNNNPIVLIHGFGASSQHWRNNVCQFEKAGFSVYSIDLIGFGLSEQPSKKKLNILNNKIWSDQLIAFLEQVVQVGKNKKAVLIGNSLGSLTALTSLTERPDLISSVIASPLPDPALSQSFKLPEKGLLNRLIRSFIHILYGMIPLEILIPLIAKTSLISFALQGAYYKSIKYDRDLLRVVSRPALRPLAASALRAMCIGMTLRSKKYTAPMMLENLSKRTQKPNLLLIWGRQDNLVPLKLGQNLVKEHPWIKLHVMENSGHCSHDESPSKFNKIVLEWLNHKYD